ncbi:DUF397 domain-containing protein [Streptomyces sp. NPDC002537]
MFTIQPDLTTAIWHKSSYSQGQNDLCIEVAARRFPGTVPIRDSKNPHGPAITPPTTAWSTFVTAVAATNGDLSA